MFDCYSQEDEKTKCSNSSRHVILIILLLFKWPFYVRQTRDIKPHGMSTKRKQKCNGIKYGK